ncbi:MAG: hypothetical protein ABQ298_12055 [Puniceicoccaceae bacterium]
MKILKEFDEKTLRQKLRFENRTTARRPTSRLRERVRSKSFFEDGPSGPYHGLGMYGRF